MEETTSAQPAAPGWSMGCAWGALVAAAPFYLFTATIVGFERRSPEDAMLIGLMMFAEIPLWIGISGYLWAMTFRASLPRGIVLAMWPIVPLAAAASFWTLDLMGTNPNWLAVAPVLLPLVAVSFGFWTRHGSHVSVGRRRAGSLGFGAAALALCLVPAIGYAQWIADAPRREAERAEEAREQAEHMAALEARCAALSADSPLEDYLDLFGGGFCYEKAREIGRSSPRRQSDAIRLLDQGALDRLNLLSELELQATPELCRSYGRAIDRRLAELRAAPIGYGEIHSTTYEQITNLGWFMARGCDLAPQVRRLAAEYRRQEPGGILAGGLEEIVRNGVGGAP